MVVTKVPMGIIKEKISEDLQELNNQVADDPQYSENFKTLMKFMNEQMPFEIFHLPDRAEVSI